MVVLCSYGTIFPYRETFKIWGRALLEKIMAVLIHYRSRVTQNSIKKKKQDHRRAHTHRYIAFNFDGSWTAELKR